MDASTDLQHPHRVRPPVCRRADEVSLVIPLTLRTMIASLVAIGVVSTATATEVRTTRVTVESVPPGAEVVLVLPGGGSSPLGITPLRKIALPRGPQLLRLRLAGHEDLQVRAEIGRKSATLVYTLTRLPAPARLIVTGDTTAAGAEIALDGRSVGRVPMDVEVPPGRHQLVVSRVGYAPWTRWLDLSEGQLLSLEIQLTRGVSTFGTLAVQSSPSGAEVVVDDLSRGTTPLVVGDLPVGPHVVVIRLPGFQEVRREITLGASETVTVDPTLLAATPTSGQLVVAVDVPGARILIDGQPHGEAPLTLEALAPGSHRIEARAEGFPAVIQQIHLDAGQSLSVSLSLEDARSQATGSIQVRANVEGASATVAGRTVTVPGVVADLSPGEHRVVVAAAGHLPVETPVTVEAGVALTLTADLKPAGRLEIESVDAPGAEVIIDGEVAGVTPWQRDLAAGPYVVSLARGGQVWVRREVEVTHGVTLLLREDVSGERPAEALRPMAHAASPLGVEQGVADFAVGWPQLVSVSVMGGILEDLDLGLGFRSMLHVTNEFEAQVRYRVVHADIFHLGIDGRVGFGVGHDQRNAFFMRAGLRASVVFEDVAALTVHASLSWYTDQLGAGQPRDTWLQTPLGLALDIPVTARLNLVVAFEADPVPGRRLLYDTDFFAMPSTVPDLQANLGLSYLF